MCFKPPQNAIQSPTPPSIFNALVKAPEQILLAAARKRINRSIKSDNQCQSNSSPPQSSKCPLLLPHFCSCSSALAATCLSPSHQPPTYLLQHGVRRAARLVCQRRPGDPNGGIKAAGEAHGTIIACPHAAPLQGPCWQERVRRLPPSPSVLAPLPSKPWAQRILFAGLGGTLAMV